MRNFVYYAPTKVFFGKDTHLQIGEIIKGYGFNKILLHYGKNSIKYSGLYQVIMNSLNKHDIDVVELGGVEPNPKLSFVHKGIELCRAQNVQLVLAVGGGSAIDSAKYIATGVYYDGDVWDFPLKKGAPQRALPVGVVLTLSAAGSEMSQSSVITNEKTLQKRGHNNELNRPLFAVCNPELTYSVNKFHTGCGIVDIMMHTLERYFTNTPECDVTDRIAESVLKSVIAAGRVAVNNPNDYDARATLMWAGSLSHNDLTGTGRDGALATCHQIEHDISGVYDFVAHGAGLAVVFPAWAKYVYKHNPMRFAQYAVRVWNCEMDYVNPERTALDGIMATENYFKDIGMPVRIAELGIKDPDTAMLAQRTTYDGQRILPSYIDLGKKEIMDILNLAMN